MYISKQPFRKSNNLFVNSNNLFVNLSNLFAISIITGPRHRKNRHIPQLTQNNPIWILVFFPLREFGFNYSCILLFYPLIDDPYFIGNRLLLAKSISLFLFITISSSFSILFIGTDLDTSKILLFIDLNLMIHHHEVFLFSIA
ncbi:hypothetical protein ACJX0J_000446 [Zea mays]